MNLDDVTEEIRELVGDGFFGHAEIVVTHVTGRVGEFHLTIDQHHYLVTIEHVEDPT
jgi:hypothetical protein